MEQNYEYQATSDIQVVLLVMKDGVQMDDLEANINIGKTVLELKQAISPYINMAVQDMHIFKGHTELADDSRLMDNDISTDDILVIQDTVA